MRASNLAVLFTCLSLAGVTLAAEKDADKDAKDKPAATPAAEQTKTGTLGAKPTTAPADVVAVLYTLDADYRLLATGDTAAKLEALAKKVAKVKVTGTIDGKTMTVSQVVDLEKKADGSADGKDKRGDRGDRRKAKSDQN